MKAAVLAAAVLILSPAGFAAAPKRAAAPKPRGVTLDVKDADVHAVLKSIQTQCGIKNLVIDPNVTGSGTFVFHDLPCRTALDIVLKTTGLAAKTYSNSLVAVGPR